MDAELFERSIQEDIMIEFVLRARKATTYAGFDFNNLPKAGNMNIVSSAVSSAIWVSEDIRKNVIFHAVLEGPPAGPKTVTFNSSEIKGFGYDERSIAEHIRFALQKSGWLELNEEVRVRKGVTAAKKSFERLVWECSQRGTIYVLDSKGKDIREAEIGKNPVFVLGDFLGLPGKTEKFLSKIPHTKISLGPRVLFASHCPVLVHNEIDRRFRSISAQASIKPATKVVG